MNINTTENLVKATSVIGLKVLSKNNGLQFTKVKDIMYDPRTQKVAYLITDEGGWFSEAKVIAFSSIDIIGPDRVMVPSEDVEVKVSKVDYDLNTLIQNDDIIKNLNIVTEDGEKLGKVVDFYFDAESGVVREFEISQGLINNITNGTKVLRVKAIKLVGTDAVIVEPEMSDDFQEQSEHQGIKGAVFGVGSAIAGTAENAKDKLAGFAKTTQEAVTKAKDNVVEATSSAVESAKPYVEKAKEAAIAAKDKIVETSEDTNQATQPYIEKAKSTISDAATNVSQAVNNNKPESAEAMVEGVKQKVQTQTQQVKDFAQQKITDAKEGIEQYKVNKAIGFTLTRDIIDPKTNQTIAKKGEVIDAEVVRKAKELDVLHLVVSEDSYS